jgi:SAM-dependent methyltransferase
VISPGSITWLRSMSFILFIVVWSMVLTKLYTELADIYHEMYQSIFDYGRQFRECHSILKKHGAKSVLELGCGAGNLAPYFLEAGYDYAGMDVAKPMLRIAARERPEARFMHGDMCRFSSRRKFDAVVILGRGFTHMTSNEQVRSALRCIRLALRPGGVLIFDNFYAEGIFTHFRKRLRERVRVGLKTITRESEGSWNLETGWTWNWDAVYMVQEGRRKRTVRDRSVLRAFTRDELRLFLGLAGFKEIRFRRGRDTMLTVAQ